MKIKTRQIFLYIVFGSIFLLASCKANAPTQLSEPIPTSTLSIESLRADPNFMAGCEKINPNSVTAQAHYNRIYPRRTTKDEVENILGKPLRTNERSWEYDNLAVVFSSSIVIELFVDGDGVTTLKDFILQYGCPDLIYAFDINEHPYGEYSRLGFIYHRLGFDFTIDHIPADLTDKAYALTYFVPGTLEDFKELFKSIDIPNKSKPMTWDDAVR